MIRPEGRQRRARGHEAPPIIGTCINCIAPGSLGATLALIVIGAAIAVTGAAIAVTAEQRKLARVRSDKWAAKQKDRPKAVFLQH